MSHSKHTKKGYSIHIEKWHRSAKQYINTCSICGCRGYDPVIEDKDFKDHVTRAELIRTLPRMETDEYGRCCDCARIQDGH